MYILYLARVPAIDLSELDPTAATESISYRKYATGGLAGEKPAETPNSRANGSFDMLREKHRDPHQRAFSRCRQQRPPRAASSRKIAGPLRLGLDSTRLNARAPLDPPRAGRDIRIADRPGPQPRVRTQAPTLGRQSVLFGVGVQSRPDGTADMKAPLHLAERLGKWASANYLTSMENAADPRGLQGVT